MSDTEQITIDYSEYEHLLHAENFLHSLEQAGVAGWEGYEDAKEIRDRSDPD